REGGRAEQSAVASSANSSDRPPPPAPSPQGGGEQIPLATALNLLKPLLEDPSVVKVGLNIKWDLSLFAKHGIALAPIDDPMLISYALYGGMDSHEKIDLIEKHLGHALTPLSDVAGKGKAQISFDQVAVERASTYSCEQADAALRLYRKLKPELARDR